MGRINDLTAAEALAVEALGFLAADPERLSGFLALSGIDPARIREAAAEPGFLAGVLDHLLGDERLLLAFSADLGHRPEAVGEARQLMGALPE